MPEYYQPKTKRELVQWIRQRYFVRGQTCHGIEKKPVKALRAIFYEMIRQHREGDKCAL